LRESPNFDPGNPLAMTWENEEKIKNEKCMTKKGDVIIL
jgi:hypothetical protein